MVFCCVRSYEPVWILFVAWVLCPRGSPAELPTMIPYKSCNTSSRSKSCVIKPALDTGRTDVNNGVFGTGQTNTVAFVAASVMRSRAQVMLVSRENVA